MLNPPNDTPDKALVEAVTGLRDSFKRIAGKAPDDQPRYADGMRPFSNGDLRHAVETLDRAAAALSQPQHGGLVEALQWIDAHKDDQDMNHVNFRIGSGSRASAALSNSPLETVSQRQARELMQPSGGSIAGNSGGVAYNANSPVVGEDAVQTTVRQRSPIIADYEDHFLVARVSKDGKMVGIDHPCDAKWSDVMVAHVALRNRINERIEQQDGCPFKPTPTDTADRTCAFCGGQGGFPDDRGMCGMCDGAGMVATDTADRREAVIKIVKAAVQKHGVSAGIHSGEIAIEAANALTAASLIAGPSKPIAEGATNNGAAPLTDAERQAAVERYIARPGEPS